MENFIKKLLNALVKKATENGKLDTLIDALAEAVLQYGIAMLNDSVKPVTPDTKPAETAKTTVEPTKPPTQPVG